MQKLKKALKKFANQKLAHLGNKPAQAAKKAGAAKKKTQPVAASKKPTAKKNAPAPKKAAPAPKKAPPPTIKVKAAAKPDPKDQKKKAAPVEAPKAPVKAPAKVAEKAHDKASEKQLKTDKVQDKSAEKAPVKKAAVEAPAPEKKASEKPQEAASDKAKAKKAREDIAAVQEAGNDQDEIILTDAEGRRYCRVKDCDQASTVDGYCRYHYLLFWKNIQNRKKILSEGKLERYIEELTARYPDKYLELLRKDLRSEKDFTAAIQELEIDDSGVDNEFEDEAQSYLEEVRGMGSESGGEREEDF